MGSFNCNGRGLRASEIVENLEQIVALGRGNRSDGPVVEEQHVGARQLCRAPPEAAGAVDDAQLLEQSWQPGVQGAEARPTVNTPWLLSVGLHEGSPWLPLDNLSPPLAILAHQVVHRLGQRAKPGPDGTPESISRHDGLALNGSWSAGSFPRLPTPDRRCLSAPSLRSPAIRQRRDP